MKYANAWGLSFLNDCWCNCLVLPGRQGPAQEAENVEHWRRNGLQQCYKCTSSFQMELDPFYTLDRCFEKGSGWEKPFLKHCLSASLHPAPTLSSGKACLSAVHSNAGLSEQMSPAWSRRGLFKSVLSRISFYSNKEKREETPPPTHTHTWIRSFCMSACWLFKYEPHIQPESRKQPHP